MKRTLLFALVFASVVSLLGLPASADGERELGPDAVLLTGNDLAVALTGVTAEGWSFDGENWFYFSEYYAPDGSIVGSGGPFFSLGSRAVRDTCPTTFHSSVRL